MSNKLTRFILLPTRGFTANTKMTTPTTVNFLTNLVRPGVRALGRGAGAQHMKVLEEILHYPRNRKASDSPDGMRDNAA